MDNRQERRRKERGNRKLVKTLKKGDGIFWDLTPEGIHLKTEEEVAQHFGVKLSGEHVDIPLDLFRQLNPKQTKYIMKMVADRKSQQEVLKEVRRLLS